MARGSVSINALMKTIFKLYYAPESAQILTAYLIGKLQSRGWEEWWDLKGWYTEVCTNETETMANVSITLTGQRMLRVILEKTIFYRARKTTGEKITLSFDLLISSIGRHLQLPRRGKKVVFDFLC